MKQNTYTPGEGVDYPGQLVGRTVQAYDKVGKVHAGIIVAASYDPGTEEILADVAILNHQPGDDRIARFTVDLTVSRGLRFAPDGRPGPLTFATDPRITPPTEKDA